MRREDKIGSMRRASCGGFLVVELISSMVRLNTFRGVSFIYNYRMESDASLKFAGLVIVRLLCGMLVVYLFQLS